VEVCINLLTYFSNVGWSIHIGVGNDHITKIHIGVGRSSDAHVMPRTILLKYFFSQEYQYAVEARKVWYGILEFNVPEARKSITDESHIISL